MIDPAKLRLVIPEYGTDQIIGVTSGTLTTAVPTLASSPKTAVANFAHGFGDSAYFAGIFTADGGTTWNDFGAMTPVISGGFPVFQTVGCDAICDTTNLVITAASYYNFTAGTGAAATVSYKVYLLAKNTMAQPITPLPTNEILLYSSDYNFEKIFMRGTSSLVVNNGNTGSVTVIHNLGYVPKVRAFRLNSTSPTTVRSVSTGAIADPQVRVDETNLVFFADETGLFSGADINASLEWRIYLEG